MARPPSTAARPGLQPFLLPVVFLTALILPVTSHAASGDGDLPTTLSIAAPMVGDAGTYSRSIVSFDDGVVTTIDPPRVRESFRLEAPRDMYGSDGRPHKVNAFHAWIQDGSGGQYDQHFFFDARSGAVVASQTLETGDDFYTERTFYPGGWKPLCGWLNALQRQTVDLQTMTGDAGNARSELFGNDCRRAYYSHVPDDGLATFRPVRVDQFGDANAVGFQQVGTPLVVLAWFTESIPYPIRLLEQLGGEDGTRFAMLDLTAFRRGSTAAAGTDDAPRGAALAPVRLAAHNGIGADETGTTHPFPWSEAWQFASEDAKVKDFVASHPTAVVRATVYNEQITTTTTGPVVQSRHADAWYFFLDDGRTARKFSVAQAEERMEASVPVVGTVPVTSDTTAVVTDLGAVPSEYDAFAAQQPIPAVASATVWWQAFASPAFRDRGANGWMHFLAYDASGTQSTAAGHLRQTITDDHFRWEASFLHISQEGKPIVLVENIVEADFGLPLGLAPPLPHAIAAPLESILRDAIDKLPVLSVMAPTEATVPLIDRPSAGTAETRLDVVGADHASPVSANAMTTTHISLVAAGAAGGVLGLAILGKFLLGGFFSRLRRDRALEQPVRRLLMETIEARPGIHLSELAGATGKGVGAVRHHVAKLLEADLVLTRNTGGYLCYFPMGNSSPDPSSASALKAEGARRILEGLGTEPLGIRPLAGRVGLAPSTVEHHLQRLVAAGLVHREGFSYGLTDKGRAAAP